MELGAEVAIVDIAPTLDRNPAAIHARYYDCDLSDELATRSVARQAVADLGGLDILVNCAAVVGTDGMGGWAVPFPEQSVQAFEGSLRLGLTSAFVFLQETAGALAESGSGSVVLFGSVYGHVGPDPGLYAGTTMENPVGYGATKGGVRQLTRYFATLFAPAVRVNCISPGGVERNQPSAFRDRYIDRTPLARMAREEDIKGAVAYLCSDMAAYVTGHDLLVDGGWTAW